jgi:hypothetical protein
LKVQVRLTARDFFAFAVWYYWHNPTTWILAFLAIFFGMYSLFELLTGLGAAIIAAVVLGIMMLLCWVVLVIIGTVVLVVRNRRNLGGTVELTEEGIVEELPHARLQIGWDAVRKPGVTRHYIFLRGLPGTVQLIPRRAFVDDAAWSECIALVKRRAGAG